MQVSFSVIILDQEGLFEFFIASKVSQMKQEEESDSEQLLLNMFHFMHARTHIFQGP